MDRHNQVNRRNIKQNLTAEDARNKRLEESVSIRKNKREENLAKKRNITISSPQIGSKVHSVPNPKSVAEINELVKMVNSDNEQDQFLATLNFRKLLSIERNPPIQQIIESGVVPKFIQFLLAHHNPNLQFEAAWALTNIASGDSTQTQIVIQMGAVPVFIQLLAAQSEEVREQAVWALGNIAGDSPTYRDFVLNAGVLGPLITLIEKSQKPSAIRNATWTLSNLCRGKPQPDFQLVKIALPILAKLVYSHDEDVLTDACWALSYLSDGSNDKIQAVIESGVARRLVQLLMHTSYAVQTPALRTIGNIVTGDDLQTQIMINVSILPCLVSLLNSERKAIRKEACWTLSNITAGNKEQIQAVIESNLFPFIIRLLETGEFDIKREAVWCISNATSGGAPEQIEYLVSNGCIKPLCELLVSYDPKVTLVALEGLENILKAGEVLAELRNTENPFLDVVEQHEGIDNMEKLQHHDNESVYQRAVSILETYFNAEEEDPDMAPSQNNEAFNFSTNVQNHQPFNF
jgi:importin subunit alpha-1